MGCEVADCTSDAVKRGYCMAHYTRFNRYGDPLAGQPPRRRSRDFYFWLKVNKDGPVPRDAPGLGPCWEWIAARDAKGYGNFADGRGGAMRAHRFAYELLVGPIPTGLQLDHLCRNRACVNPAHLEPVTHTENQRRGQTFTTANSAKTHCIHGHALTPDNVYGYKGRRQCKACARMRARGMDPATAPS